MLLYFYKLFYNNMLHATSFYLQFPLNNIVWNILQNSHYRTKGRWKKIKRKTNTFKDKLKC